MTDVADVMLSMIRIGLILTIGITMGIAFMSLITNTLRLMVHVF